MKFKTILICSIVGILRFSTVGAKFMIPHDFDWRRPEYSAANVGAELVGEAGWREF